MTLCNGVLVLTFAMFRRFIIGRIVIIINQGRSSTSFIVVTLTRPVYQWKAGTPLALLLTVRLSVCLLCSLEHGYTQREPCTTGRRGHHDGNDRRLEEN